jgi:hypothetical protein
MMATTGATLWFVYRCNPDQELTVSSSGFRPSASRFAPATGPTNKTAYSKTAESVKQPSEPGPEDAFTGLPQHPKVHQACRPQVTASASGMTRQVAAKPL